MRVVTRPRVVTPYQLGSRYAGKSVEPRCDSWGTRLELRLSRVELRRLSAGVGGSFGSSCIVFRSKHYSPGLSIVDRGPFS